MFPSNRVTEKSNVVQMDSFTEIMRTRREDGPSAGSLDKLYHEAIFKCTENLCHWKPLGDSVILAG